MIQIPFTIETDRATGRPYAAVNGVPETGYATDREALLYHALVEREATIKAQGERIQFYEAETVRKLREVYDLSDKLGDLERQAARLKQENEDLRKEFVEAMEKVAELKKENDEVRENLGVALEDAADLRALADEYVEDDDEGYESDKLSR